MNRSASRLGLWLGMGVRPSGQSAGQCALRAATCARGRAGRTREGGRPLGEETAEDSGSVGAGGVRGRLHLGGRARGWRRLWPGASAPFQRGPGAGGRRGLVLSRSSVRSDATQPSFPSVGTEERGPPRAAPHGFLCGPEPHVVTFKVHEPRTVTGRTGAPPSVLGVVPSPVPQQPRGWTLFVLVLAPSGGTRGSLVA